MRSAQTPRRGLTGAVVELAEPGGAVWVHPSVVVRPSAIASGGLHATAPSPAGVVVIRLGGRLVDTATLHGVFEHAAPGEHIDTFAGGDDVHLVLPPGTTAHYGNHSCEPTLWPVGADELATCAGRWRRADLQRRSAGDWPPGLQQQIAPV